MTPQPRHLDLARDIIDKYHDFRHPLQVEDMARALAEAENRAAWDVKQNQPDESTYEWLEAKYGPRPTTENQP